MKDLKKHFITTFVLGCVLLVGIVVLINMIFNNINVGRFDLTAEQIYKLSPSVKKILSQLEAPIEITYYVSSSEKMPSRWKNLERDVIDKLKELELASSGNLTYTVFDPSAEEEKEVLEESKDKDEDPGGTKITRKKIAEQLAEKGVIPFGVQSTERDEFAIKRVYSSLVLSYLDRKEEVIEEVRPETFGSLEYEVMSLIYRLISNRRPKVGFFPAEPEQKPQFQQYYMQQQPQDRYSTAVRLLKEAGYDVERTNIQKDDSVPDNIETMLVMIDESLNERQMYEIDKLVHRGVRLIMSAQTYNYQISQARGKPGEFEVRGMPSRINVNSLTKSYGFEFDDAMFMDKNSAYIQIPVMSTRSMGMFQIQQQRLEPVTKPVIIRIAPENMNNSLSISNKITDLFYLFGGRLLIDEVTMDSSGLDYETLFSSSEYSWTRRGRGWTPVDVSPPNPGDVLEHQPLGILVEGQFEARYVDQNIPKWPKKPDEKDDDEEEEPDQPSEITGGSQENKMIIVGCSNMFKDDVLESAPSHRAFLQNCVDALTLGDELINIRSKNVVIRRIKATGSFGKALAKGFVVWFAPICFVVLGFVITIRRKVK